MLRCEILDVQGFDPAIHGMRNPKNSWDKSDSYDAVDCGKCGLIEERVSATKKTDLEDVTTSDVMQSVIMT